MVVYVIGGSDKIRLGIPHTNNLMFYCDICKSEFIRKDNYERHAKTHQKPCKLCKMMFTSIKERNQHEKRCRQQIRVSNFEQDFQTSLTCESAINNRFKIFSIEPINEVDYESAIKKNFETIKQTLNALLRYYSATKFYTIFEAKFRKEINGLSKTFGFYSNTLILLHDSNIDNLITQCEEKINTSIDSFQRQGSGWIFEEFTCITLHVTEYRPCAGGTFLELPPALKSKRSLLNIKNTDDR